MATIGRTVQIAIATLLGGLAAVLILVATDPGEPTTATSTIPLAIGTTTTTTQPSTTTTSDIVTFARLLPKVDGTLFATINGATDSLPLRLVEWIGDEPPETGGISTAQEPALAFDADGGWSAAFLGTGGEGQLFLRHHLEPWFSFHGDTQAFAWHTTQPGVLAWQTGDQTCRTDTNSSEDPWLTCIGDIPGELIGYDDSGYLLSDNGSIVRVTVAGDELARLTADDAEIGPDGRILLISTDEDAQRHFSIASAHLDGVEPLPWVPRDAFGEYGFVEWGPDQLMAFLRYTSDQEWKVSIYWPWGRHVSTFDLPERFWNLKWSNNGRYLVLPGVNEQQDVALVLDVLSGERVLFPHPTRVQDAHLITSRCMEASPMIDGLADFLEDQTESSLLETKAVMSRDLGLESWLYISAIVSNGPHHGDIATWAYAGFNFIGEPAPLNLIIPANDVAEAIGPIENTYAEEPGEWMGYDGAQESQACLND